MHPSMKRMFFLRMLKKARLPQDKLLTFFCCSIESILTYCISTWYLSCSASDRKALQHIVSSVGNVTGTQLLALEDIYTTRCLRKATNICEEHPCRHSFVLLLSGSSTEPSTTTLKNSFFSRAVAALNHATTHK